MIARSKTSISLFAFALFAANTTGVSIGEITPERIIAVAQDHVPLAALRDKCELEIREEKRLWLVDDRQPQYVLVLLNRINTEGIRGTLAKFVDCSFSDAGKLDGLCKATTIDTDPANWTPLYASIVDWRNTDAKWREPGDRAGLSILVESCHEGVYDTYVHAAETEEAKAVSGIVISVAELWVGAPSN